MVRRRRFKATYLLGSLLVLAASLHPTTAYSAAGDPPSGSPAGAVYQLPLEQGRSDAAPKGDGGTGAEVGSGGSGGAGTGEAGSASGESGESSSLYRSENNFGSSSQVPGVAATGAGGSGGDPGNTSGGAAGVGSQGVAAAGGAPVAGSIVAAETVDNGNTSISASIVLLGAIALLAIVVGILSRRYARRHVGTSS